ncbi:hypothetical protein CAEBREN_18545 [Caenorhabditis brenneri]|uniref:Nicotinamide-nucleotide adenylyltransferase n=1 Tax=Caenorhabditis brenneri TaxID=135651 RepID=G0MGS2_CAEBE|nr:hypothetical protein CAEBREN_18545 [Caenorhabditis brenneri]
MADSKTIRKKAVIVAPGSYNPPTYGHLRMLEDAKASLETDGYEVHMGIMTPVSDGYGKKSLISASHRLAMTVIATENSDWIRADKWECSIPEWTTTLCVLKYHENEAKKCFGNDVEVFLLVGGDVVETFDKFYADGTPIWKQEDVAEIVSTGLIVQPRPGSNPEKTISEMKLNNGLTNVHIIKNAIASNAISSTKLRQAIKENRSIKYLTPDSVIQYIEEANLYK